MPLHYDITYGSNTYQIWNAPDLRTPYRWRQPRKEYPIEGNSSIYTLVEDYIQLIEFYEQLQPAARHPEFANLFFVNDSPIQDVGRLAIGKFQRYWSVLPGYGDKGYVRSEYESYAYTVPALNTDQTAFYQFPVASTTLSNGNHVITVTLGEAPFNALDIVAGKPATIHYIVTDPLNGQQMQRQIVRKALAVTSNTLTVGYISDIGPIQLIGVQRADVQQNSYTKQVMSRVDYTYYIPGVNCDSVSSIPIISELQIIDNRTGGRVEYLSETTTPSIDTWYDYVANDEWIVAQPSVVRLWKGNIYEKATRYVRAVL